MEREIKFRAWNAEDGVMIDAEHLAFEEYAPLVDQLKSCHHLMQFTGLLDKKKVEIYEGDILNWHSGGYGGEKAKGDVYYENGQFDVRKYQISGFLRDNGITNWGEVSQHFIIIGNIYQNPSLLNP